MVTLAGRVHGGQAVKAATGFQSVAAFFVRQSLTT